MAKKPRKANSYYDPFHDPYPPEKRVSYSDIVVPVETVRAKNLLIPALRPKSPAPLYIDIEGDCPRCAHSISDHHPVTIIVKGLTSVSDDVKQQIIESLIEEGALPRSGSEEWVMRCNCNQEHDFQPDNDKSCGSRFTVNVTW